MADQLDQDEPQVEVIEGVVGPPIPAATKKVRLASEEFVRAGLAFVFAGMLAATGAWAFVEVHSKSWPHVEALLNTLIPAESALLGSAVGFYFGTKTNQAPR